LRLMPKLADRDLRHAVSSLEEEFPTRIDHPVVPIAVVEYFTIRSEKCAFAMRLPSIVAGAFIGLLASRLATRSQLDEIVHHCRKRPLSLC
jgi:hypothetical protein